MDLTCFRGKLMFPLFHLDYIKLSKPLTLKMKLLEVFRKLIYSEGVNPLPGKLMIVMFTLAVSVLLLKYKILFYLMYSYNHENKLLDKRRNLRESSIS